MSRKMIKRGIKYGSCLVFTFLVVWLCVWLRDAESVLDTVQILRIATDSCTLAGTLMLGVGCLIALANEGSLTGVSYCVNTAVNALIPGGRKRIKSYAEYAAEKKENRVKGYGFLLISGAVDIGIAFLALAVYYKVR